MLIKKCFSLKNEKEKTSHARLRKKNSLKENHCGWVLLGFVPCRLGIDVAYIVPVL